MLLYDIDVITPSSLDEALEILSSRKGRVKVVAGGTDLIIQMKDGIIPRMDLLNIYGLDELRYIKLDDNDVIRIGALTSFSEIAGSEIIRRYAKILAEAASTVGSIQIMNKASIGGNIVNASPAADSLPPLYALDAIVKVASSRGFREVPIESFYRGYKKLDLAEDELVCEVRLRAMSDDEDGVFLKHGLRLGDAIAVVNAAIWVKRDNRSGLFSDARVALGAVAPTVVRARRCEQLIINRRLDDDSMWSAARAVLESISPIDDVRGSAEYRREMSVNLVYMGLWELTHRSG